MPFPFPLLLLLKVAFSCTPPSASPTSFGHFLPIIQSHHSPSSPSQYAFKSPNNIRTFSNQFISGVPQNNQIDDGNNAQQFWGQNRLNNVGWGPKDDRLPEMQQGRLEGITASTIQGQTPGDQNNDLQLLEPTLASITTIPPQYSLNSFQITPINIEEEDSIKLSTISYKNDVPIPKVPKIDLDSSKKSLIPSFVPLDCPQNGSKNYGELLNCLEVEVKPFDGFSFVQRELPIPIPQQICNFDGDENSNEKCSFYSTQNEPLQFNLGRFHGNKQNNGKFIESFGQLMKRPNGEMPNGNFLVLIEPEGEGNMATNSAILKLDIACQNGNGQLSFNYWCTFREFSMKVCTRIGGERHCTSEIEYSTDSSRVDIQVVNPTKNGADHRFGIEIIANGFLGPSILILDNLIYEANSCDGENGGEKIAEAKIFVPKAAAIPFEGENEELELYSEPILPSNYKKIEVKPSQIKMENEAEIEEEIRSKFWPSLAYPMARKVVFEKDAKMQKEMLKLMHFWENPSSLKLKLNSTKMRMDPWGENEEENEFELNGNGRRKELYDRIDSLRKLRKLRLASNLGRKGQMDICELLECKFSNNDFCHYSQVESGQKFKFGKWKIARPKPPNINIKSRKTQKLANLLGQKRDEQQNNLKHFGFAFVGNENIRFLAEEKFGRKIYILQSPEFKLGENKTVELQFDILKRTKTNSIAFQICLNSIMNCIYKATNDERGEWRRGQKVKLPSETKRIFIMATEKKDEGNGGILAIDNIQIKIDGKECSNLI